MSKSVLVSGASGFIASHAVEMLLRDGVTVKGTVRDPSDRTKVAHLTAMPGAAERLTLVAADLTDPDPFSAHADVDAVLHMASPYVISVKDPQRDLVDPAVEGTLSMLRAAKANPRVRRVVLTSSMAAITDQPDGRVLTEADWNTKSSLRRNPYYLSKTLAERAAWEFMAREKPGFDLVVINPFLVIGPSHSRAVSTSNQVFADLIKGLYPVVMDLRFGLVDVRDVALAHLRAIDAEGAQGRYICAAGTLPMHEIADLIRAEGWRKAKVPTRRMDGAVGTAILKLASHFQGAGVGSYLRTHLGGVPRFDTAKIRRDLGMEFRDPRQSIRDTLADMVRWGPIPAPDTGPQVQAA